MRHQIDEKFINRLKAFFFSTTSDIRVQSNRNIYLPDGTNLGDIVDVEYVVLTTTANLANERQLTAGDGLDLTDGGAGGNVTLAVDVTDFIDTTAGLTETSNNIQVNLGTGLSFDGGGAIQVTNTTGHVIQEEGGNLTQRSNINFRGAYVTAADDSLNDATTVDILEDTEVANTVLAGPSTGADAKPVFRALVENDLPAGAFVPIGGIILWSGSVVSIPSNWALCNGLSGTPDLTDKFVMGAGSSFTPGDTGGASTINISHSHTSGTLATSSDNHSHTSGTLATNSDGHTHALSGSTAADTHSHTAGTLAATGSASGVPVLNGAAYTVNTEFHTHSISGSTDTDNHSHGVGTLATGSDSHSHSVNAGTTGSDSHSHSVNAGTTGSSGSATQSVLNPYYALAYIMRIA